MNCLHGLQLLDELLELELLELELLELELLYLLEEELLYLLEEELLYLLDDELLYLLDDEELFAGQGVGEHFPSQQKPVFVPPQAQSPPISGHPSTGSYGVYLRQLYCGYWAEPILTATSVPGGHSAAVSKYCP